MKNTFSLITLLTLFVVVTMLFLGCPEGTTDTDSNTDIGIEGTLSYTNIVAITNTTITQVEPSWTPDAPAAQTVSYSIVAGDTALPEGLTLDPSTGVISGTPKVATGSVSYKITATGTGNYSGTKTATITIQITDAPKVGGTFSYTNIVAITNTTITKVDPSWSPDKPANQTVSYSIAAGDTALPEGLTLDPITGAISGTPQVATGSVSYKITATGTGSYSGTQTADITIAITAELIGTFSYTNIVATTSTTITKVDPSWTPDKPAAQTVSYSIAAGDTALPEGLTLDPITGAISGTPQVATGSVSYKITATGTGSYIGTQTADITIAITAELIGTFSYTNIVATISTTITKVDPSWTPDKPAAQTMSYSIAAGDTALPEGLVLDPITGAISGTPQVATGSVSYKITATGTGNYIGTQTADITIAITVELIGTFSYANLTTTINTAITKVDPSWTPDKPAAQTVSYSIAAGDTALPEGLTLDPITGAISGTPQVAITTTNYNITATGTGNYSGTQTATITIRITIVPEFGGTFTYDTSISSIGFGTTTNFSPIWDEDKPANQTVVYSISPEFPVYYRVKLNTTTGEISSIETSGEYLRAFSATYTITATGTGDYTNGNPNSASYQVIIAVVKTTITGTLTFTDGTNTYGDGDTATLTQGTAISWTAVWENENWTDPDPSDNAELISYSGFSRDNLSVNESGVISGAPSASHSSANTLQINAFPSGFLQAYTGQISIRINIIVLGPPLTGSFSYDEVNGIEGQRIPNAFTRWVDVESIIQETETPYEFTIDPELPAGLTIQSGNGAITGTPSAGTAQARTCYEVTAEGSTYSIVDDENEWEPPVEGSFSGTVLGQICIAIQAP